MRLNGPVELRVAANADMMLVVRLATAGVTARAGLTLDAMDGFKMAAEEACNCLIGQSCPPEELLLRFVPEEKRLRLTVTGLGGGARGEGMDETETEIARCILEALADEVALHAEDGCVHAIELCAATA